MKRSKNYHVVMQDGDELIIVSAVTEEELFSAIEQRLPDDFWIFYGVRFDTLQAVFEDAPMPNSELSRVYTRLLISYSEKRKSEEGATHHQANEILSEDSNTPFTMEDVEAVEFGEEEMEQMMKETEEDEEIPDDEEFNNEFGAEDNNDD